MGIAKLFFSHSAMVIEKSSKVSNFTFFSMIINVLSVPFSVRNRSIVYCIRDFLICLCCLLFKLNMDLSIPFI